MSLHAVMLFLYVWNKTKMNGITADQLSGINIIVLIFLVFVFIFSVCVYCEAAAATTSVSACFSL